MIVNARIMSQERVSVLGAVPTKHKDMTAENNNVVNA
jgi:hypothetical protein